MSEAAKQRWLTLVFKVKPGQKIDEIKAGEWSLASWGHVPDQRDRAEDELSKACEALKQISAIQNEEYGPDWDEIERARAIADAFLKEMGHE